MNPDPIEQELTRTAQPAPPALRGRVLGAVEEELRSRRRDRRWALTAAATLLLGVFANVSLDALPGPGPRLSNQPTAARADVTEMTRAIAEATDEPTARWFEQWLLASLGRKPTDEIPL